jgi:FkbM family methyltransferase
MPLGFDLSKCSQGNQDIIINNVFKKISTTNKFCVEFGFNSRSLTVGTGANTANLIINEGWESVLFDGEFENKEINLHKEFITVENICNIFKKYNVPTDLDYLSIDVDSIDLWLFDAVLKEYKPKLVSVEYNANFSIDEAITFPNDTNEIWGKDKGYGASLKALKLAADKHNYHLINVEKSLDCFFIHNDFKKYFNIPPLSSFKNKCLTNPHPPLNNTERHKIFLDYEVYLKTGGDVGASQKAAEKISKLRLTQGGPRKSVKKMINNLNTEGAIHIGANFAQEADLYKNKNMNVIWIDALSNEKLTNRLKQYPLQLFINELITDQDGKEYTFYISNNEGASSSILELEEHKEVWPEVNYSNSIKLKSKKLDTVISEHNINARDYPSLVMDAQGSELMILKGASQYLKTCEEIILEAPNFNSYKNCPQVNHFDDYLMKEGFKQINKERFASKGNKEYYNILYKNNKDAICHWDLI